MRIPSGITASFLLLASSLSAQATTKISFNFDAEVRPATRDPSEVGNVLAQRTALRAWTDSVDVFLDQDAMGAREHGWLRARAGEQANFMLNITALPVMGANGVPTGMVTYSLVLFEPAALGGWKYVTNFAGYSMNAQEAAHGIFRAAIQGINAKRSR